MSRAGAVALGKGLSFGGPERRGGSAAAGSDGRMGSAAGGGSAAGRRGRCGVPGERGRTYGEAGPEHDHIVFLVHGQA